MTEKTEQMTSGDGRQTAGAESGSEDSASFDDLLTEFETKTKTKADSKVLKDFGELADYVRQDRAEKQQASVEKDIEAAVDYVAKDLKGIPKDTLREWLEGHGARNKALSAAFQNRSSDPQAWNAELEKAKGRIAETLKILRGNERKPRDDLEAAKAAVAKTETEADDSDESDLPSVDEMFNMSGSDWRRFMDNQRVKASR